MVDRLIGGLKEEWGYDVAEMPACSLTSAYVDRRKGYCNDDEQDKEGEHQLISEHIVTSVSILLLKGTHVFTSIVTT